MVIIYTLLFMALGCEGPTVHVAKIRRKFRPQIFSQGDQLRVVAKFGESCDMVFDLNPSSGGHRPCCSVLHFRLGDHHQIYRSTRLLPLLHWHLDLRSLFFVGLSSAIAAALSKQLEHCLWKRLLELQLELQQGLVEQNWRSPESLSLIDGKKN